MTSTPSLYLLDPEPGPAWAPFAGARPIAELRAGAHLIRERWEAFVGTETAAVFALPHLAGFAEPGSAPVRPRGPVSGPAVIGSSTFAPRGLAPALPDEPSRLVCGGVTVGWGVPAGARWEGPAREARAVEVPGIVLHGVHGLLPILEPLLREDLRAMLPGADPIPAGSIVIGDPNLVAVTEGLIEPGVVFDTSHGPVVVESGVEVRSGSRLEGPLWVGANTRILGGPVRASAIGPRCTVRGEISTCVFLGYANKAHDGFLGHSVVGRWANLGAGTINSNLKNTYGPVRLEVAGHAIETGQMNLGSLIGDHAKTAIGTLLSTGTVIGVGANVFDGVRAPKYVPPFAWGGAGEARTTRDGFLRVVERVLPRRDVVVDEATRALLGRVYDWATGGGPMTDPGAPKGEGAFRRIHKFELHERIGEGAMGVVWKAYDSVLRRFVALKLLNPSFGRTQELRERFHREARAAAALQHPNIVTVYDLGESDGQLFIAMELVEGRDLSDLIAVRAPLPLEHKLDLVIELLQGLGYAHARGVIHRDVKPSNVRIASDGRVKIMDFGIARLQNTDRTGSGGVIVGTPSYMAPEQITNGEITPATDVFAVGCLLYEVLTYERPFEAETVHGVFYQVLSTTPKPLRTVAPSIPASLERVTLKAMAKTPEERFGTAEEFRSSLLGLRHALSDPATSTTERIDLFRNPLTRISLRLFAPASLKSRVTVLFTLLGATLLVLYLALSTPTPPAPAAPVGGRGAPRLSPHAVSGLPARVATLRDSAYGQRARALAVGALVNNVQSMINADGILLAADQSARANDLVRASTGYGSVGPMYRKAVAETDSERLDARKRLDRSTTLVRSMKNPAASSRAGASLARADSLFTARDYVMSAIASGAAEQAAIAGGARVRTVTPQPQEPHAAIYQLLDDFSRAIQSRRVSNMRVLYPSITAKEVKSWEQFFDGVSSVDVTFATDSLTIKNPTARGVVHAHFLSIHAGSPTPQESQQTLVTSFRHNPGGWRITGILTR